jgi:hypothetical protein
VCPSHLQLRKFDRDWLIADDQASVLFDVETGKGVAGLEP